MNEKPKIGQLEESDADVCNKLDCPLFPEDCPKGYYNFRAIVKGGRF